LLNKRGIEITTTLFPYAFFQLYRKQYNGFLRKRKYTDNTIAATYFFFRTLFSKTEKDESKFEIMKKQETIRSGCGKVKEIQRLHLKNYSLRLNDLRRKGIISLILAASSYHFGSWRKAVESSGIYYLLRRGNKKNKK